MVKLLVIDDDRMNCDLIKSVFNRNGYQVLSATSGFEGLTLFREHAPRVTILDLRMPEMDGLTVLKEIRAYDPHAAVIILGGGATEEQENHARGLRVTDFIRKGLSLDVLVASVNQVVQLPAKPPSSLRASSSVAVADMGETILVVDDEPLIRDLIVQFLSLRGYRALGVKDGSDALAMVEQAPPDLILLDLFLPGMDGAEVLRQLRQRDYAGGVILITGSHDEDTLDEAWALGPQEVIGKPIDLEQLLTSIQLVLVCREC
ncbi:MAG: response regulator [Nitrospirota bacterium]